MKRIAVIMNRESGSVEGSEPAAAVISIFRKHGIDPEVALVPGREVRSAARGLRDRGFDIIVAAGGDGTVSAVASELVGSRCVLGVLPLGTLNHFAADLGLPPDYDDCLSLIDSGSIAKIDAGEINGRYFVNNASLGLYPDQLRLRAKLQPYLGKWLAMAGASIGLLTRLPYVRATAEIDGRLLRMRCQMILVSNNAYSLEPGDLSSRKSLDRGELGIYFLREGGVTGLLRVAVKSLISGPAAADEFQAFTSSEMTLHLRRKRIRVALDGEVYRFSTPLRFRIVREGLSVIAPVAARSTDEAEEAVLPQHA